MAEAKSKAFRRSAQKASGPAKPPATAPIPEGVLIAGKAPLDAGGATHLYDGPTRDFIAAAFSHCKFICYTQAAILLLQKAGIAETLDEGCIALPDGVDEFVGMPGELRVWSRELKVDMAA